MPFIYALVGALITAVGTMLGRALLALGVGVITYTGFKISIDYLMNLSVNHFQKLPTEVAQIVYLTGIGSVISIIASAVLVRAMLKGLQSDTLKSFVIK